MSSNTGAKELYKKLDWDAKLKLRVRVGSILSKFGEKGLEKKVNVGEVSLSVCQVVRALRFRPRQGVKLEYYNMAIMLYKVERKISRAYFKANLMNIVFFHHSWIKPEHEPIIKDMINRIRIKHIPAKMPSTMLQKLYLRRLIRLLSYGKVSIKARKLRPYILSNDKLTEFFAKVMYKQFIKRHPKYWRNSCHEHILKYSRRILKNTPRPPVGDLSMSEHLFMNLVLKKWSPIDGIFMDVSVVKEWSLKDRPFITQLVYCVLVFTNYDRIFLAHIRRMLSRNAAAMTEFFVTFVDGKLLNESWPDHGITSETWRRFFTVSKFSYHSIMLDASFLLKEGNEKILKHLMENSPSHIIKVLEYANIEQLIKLCAINVPQFCQFLYERHPQKLMDLLRLEYCHKKIVSGSMLTKMCESSDNDDIDIVMLMIIRRKIDMGKVLYCLANGKLPPKVIPWIDKLICDQFRDVVDNTSLYEYFSGSREFSMEGLSNIPSEILGDNLPLCTFIAKKAWDVMKTDPGRRWPWNQTVATAILLLPQNFEKNN